MPFIRCIITNTDIAAFEKSAIFDAAISDPSYANWKPPGELWRSIEAGGQTYEIWKGSLSDLAVQQLVKRIQILVPFFIEGGTFIELKDSESSLERWTVFFLYQKKSVEHAPEFSPYIFMGYSTVYRYFYFQPHPASPSAAEKQLIQYEATSDFELPVAEFSFSDLPCRSRISQFVILPPFQGGGNGSRFYNAMFDFYFQQSQTVEITVEDPNEAFDDLRDINDLMRLRKIPEFAALRIDTSVIVRAKGHVPNDIVKADILDSLRQKMKIAPRQFARVVEMQLLSLIPSTVRQSLLLERPKSKLPDLKERQHEYHLWQIFVKNRLYKHNRDTLIQLDRAERIDKLDEALGSVEADYGRLLRNSDRRHNGNEIAASSSGKRRSPDDENMEDNEHAAKKVKFTA